MASVVGLVGARKPQQSLENAAAADFTLSDSEMEAISDALGALDLES
jgi:aryl-alcohol dehydrogenase-like predicted oxidoreductase